MAKTRAAAPEPARVGKRTGFVKATFSLTPAQVDALRAQAEKRRPSGALRADASEVLRELLDAWMAKASRK